MPEGSTLGARCKDLVLRACVCTRAQGGRRTLPVIRMAAIMTSERAEATAGRVGNVKARAAVAQRASIDRGNRVSAIELHLHALDELWFHRSALPPGCVNGGRRHVVRELSPLSLLHSPSVAQKEGWLPGRALVLSSGLRVQER